MMAKDRQDIDGMALQLKQIRLKLVITPEAVVPRPKTTWRITVSLGSYLADRDSTTTSTSVKHSNPISSPEIPLRVRLDAS
ncbi:hypothetical protein BDZ45DRAFT_248174 [Acephala macrosclerotiorum]|nr:hypothetical protein BDZ45DRAFT_248174 [Acephala macrosclerotiorum]